MVKFGINLQLEEYPVDLALKAAQQAESLKLDAVFVNDHYMKPSGNNVPDAFLVLTAMAVQTKRIRLGTAVTPIPFRSAPQTAKVVSTLDNISMGRFMFGVGAGWNQAEFEGYGRKFPPPKERVSETFEGIRLMKRMWTEDEVTFEGKYNRVKRAVLLPKPVQKPYPPILVGSRSERMCRFAAKECNGWIPGHLSSRDYKHKMNEIINEAEKHGRRRSEFTFVHFTRILTGPHMDEVSKLKSKDQMSHGRERFLVGSPKFCLEKLQEYVDVGVDMILLRLEQVARTSLENEEKHREHIEFIRDEILSQL
jgi:alkanesulfonate monooxygenase SsuD/methylene tetrahydromethanopterin reductase-like flavin-dependent oxidoreductase (luciferase family)